MTTVLPACPFSSTCVTSCDSRHTHPEGEPCVYILGHNIYISLEDFHLCLTIVSVAYVHLTPTWGWWEGDTIYIVGVFVFDDCIRCTSREAARTPRRKFGPRPRSVARALGVQSREDWQVTTGGAFRARRAIQAHANPHVQVQKMSDGLRTMGKT